MSATQSEKILLAGCGALGSAIGSNLAPGCRVWGLRRHAAAIPAPIQPLEGDLTRRETLAGILKTRFDLVIYTVTPSTMDDAGYRDAYVTGLDNLLSVLEQEAEPPCRLLFVSSTAVYHQNDDSWVDEDSPTHPRRFSGQRLLEAEQRLAASSIPGTSLRLSGIYGPGRAWLLDRVRRGWWPETGDSPFTNRIHETDAAGAISHLARRALRGDPLEDRYLITDCEPARLIDVVRWIRDRLQGVPPITEAGGGNRRGGSKQCSNARLLASGYVLRYPSFREGYGEMLEALKG